MVIIHKVIRSDNEDSETDSYTYYPFFMHCPKCGQENRTKNDDFLFAPPIGTSITCSCGETSKIVDTDSDENDRIYWHWRVQCPSNTTGVGADDDIKSKIVE